MGWGRNSLLELTTERKECSKSSTVMVPWLLGKLGPGEWVHVPPLPPLSWKEHKAIHETLWAYTPEDAKITPQVKNERITSALKWILKFPPMVSSVFRGTLYAMKGWVHKLIFQVLGMFFHKCLMSVPSCWQWFFFFLGWRIKNYFCFSIHLLFPEVFFKESMAYFKR